ncbi:DUF6944 family repetitive protein [Bacillus alkalisoli]|uniref:DUF6944 family repetitive protein n=1 Tax=Bacillus alkalisoli TaxID=2011008 RepID=UPI000C238624|nr:hypothetical protein [Bacillus alkalisoli]
MVDFKNSSQISKSDKHNANPSSSLEEKLFQGVATGVWIQLFGQIIEAVSFSKLVHSKGEKATELEKGILLGIWISAIGNFLEAIGVSQQLTVTSPEKKLQAQRLSASGNWAQALGAGVEATNETAEIRKEEEGLISPSTTFVP